MKSLTRILPFAALLLAAVGFNNAVAQTFPSKPIRVIVPFPPGGSVDALMRFLGPQISESTGQPFLVENRPGGATFIGMSACAKSPPDGYTMCATTPDSLTFSTFLYANVPFDADNDFVGITNLVITSGVLYTGAKSSFASFKDLMAQAKAKPGSLNFATWGPGSAPDLYARYINKELGLGLVQVPYKGAAPALQAGLAGEVQVAYFGIGAVLPHFRSGKLKPLVVTGRNRSPYLPDVPSLAEFGIDPGIVSYFGLYGPAKIPAPAVERLNAEVVKALRSPTTGKFVSVQTLEVVGNSPAEFAKFMKTDRENAGRLLKALGVQLQQAMPN